MIFNSFNQSCKQAELHQDKLKKLTWFSGRFAAASSMLPTVCFDSIMPTESSRA